MVRLVHEHDVGVRQLPVAAHAAGPQRLDAGDLHALHQVERLAGEDHAGTTPNSARCARVWKDELAAVGEKQNVLVRGLPDDFRRDDRLAATSGRDKESGARRGRHQPGDHVALIRANLDHAARLALRKSASARESSHQV